MKGFKRWRDWSIRSKVNAILVPALLPLMVMAWITYSSHGETSIKRSQQIAQVVTSSNAEELDMFMIARRSTFDEWTSEDVYGMGIEFDVLDKTAARLRELLAAAPEFCLLVLTDAEGKALVAVPQAGADSKGLDRLLGSVIPVAEGLGGMAEGRVIFTESKLMKTIGQVLDKTFVFEYPCRNSAGEMNGVFLAYLDWSTVQAHTVKVANSLVDNGFPGARATILDARTGHAVTHSDAREAGTELGLDDELTTWLAQPANTGETVPFAMDGRTEYLTFAPVLNPASLNSQDGEMSELLLLTTLIPADDILVHVRKTLWVNTGILATSAVFLLTVFWLISGNISSPIRRAAGFAQAVASGDLTGRIAAEDIPKDEVGDLAAAMNQMTENLGEIVGQIDTAAAETVTASQAQAQGAKNQSVTTEEMTSTVSELLASTKKMAENATSVSDQADLAAKECASGKVSVESTVHGIKGIHERVEKIAAHMLELGSKSQEISGVLDIITELSEQTNLLSLNASIEAAGAGEAGKRFAVVASEIRKLAERATDSTGEIRSLIDGVQETVNATIMATEEGTKSVAEGVRLTEEVDKSFGRIAEQVASTTESVKAIELGSRQQTTAVEQMEGAVKNVDTAAQETAETARQLDTNAQALLTTARRLQGNERKPQAV